MRHKEKSQEEGQEKKVDFFGQVSYLPVFIIFQFILKYPGLAVKL
ncbi:MAG: hypothetical protein ABSB18_06815 [Candidatus Omnitrophota bacterium]